MAEDFLSILPFTDLDEDEVIDIQPEIVRDNIICRDSRRQAMLEFEAKRLHRSPEERVIRFPPSPKAYFTECELADIFGASENDIPVLDIADGTDSSIRSTPTESRLNMDGLSRKIDDKLDEMFDRMRLEISNKIDQKIVSFCCDVERDCERLGESIARLHRDSERLKESTARLRSNLKLAWVMNGYPAESLARALDSNDSAEAFVQSSIQTNGTAQSRGEAELERRGFEVLLLEADEEQRLFTPDREGNSARKRKIDDV